MGFISSIKSMFSPLPEGSVRYKGFTIAATPEEDFGRFRINATITKQGKQRHFTMIDRIENKENCVEMTHMRAKNLIDQKGDRVFIN